MSEVIKNLVLSYGEPQIGVDIEYKAGIEDYNNIENLVYSEEEKNYIKNGNRRDRFYELWTKKEALVKGIGIGLSKNIKNISIGRHDVYYGMGYMWQITKIESDIDYVAHVAYEGDSVINNLNHFRFK